MGDSLVNAVIEWAREQQASKLILAVLERSARALALCRRHPDVGANPCTSSEAERKMALSLLQAVR
jgi:hypothetical protein